MIIHNVKQGSREWLDLRSGIPTASAFDRILTPTGKRSTSADSYLHLLIAERIMGHPEVGAVSMWMGRGTQLEAEAVAFYELQRDCDSVPVGFITNDDGTVGASPDRLVGDEGLLEIKVPAPHTHVGYLLSQQTVDRAYYPQCMGQLWITGRKWLDIVSYHPEMPPALVRLERDEKFIAILADAITEFSIRLQSISDHLAADGIIKPKTPPEREPTVEEFLGVSISDFLACTGKATSFGRFD
jgi:hypothetical protein